MPIDDPAKDDPEQLAAFEQKVMSTLVDDGEDPAAPTEDEDPNAGFRPAPTPTAAPAAAGVPATPAAPVAVQAAAPVPTQAPAAPAAPSGTAAAPSTPAQPAAPAAPGEKVDWRAATFSARQDVRLARERAEAAEAEVARLRASVPATPDPVTKAIVSAKEALPEHAAAFEALQGQIAKLQAANAPPAPAPIWAPVPLTPELQAAVNANDELAFYHGSKDHQGIFDAIAAADALLFMSPAWKARPVAERLTEAMNRAKQELSTPVPAPPPDAATVAAQAAAAASAQTPALSTLSDLRGGVPPSNTEPDYSRMTDAQIEAHLARMSAALV